MNKYISRKMVPPIVAFSMIIGVLLALPQVPINAQTSDGSYQLFGVNLVGTLPVMNKNGQSTTSGDLQTLDSRMYLKIPMGTIIHNAAGKNQEFISATLVPNPSSLTAEQKPILAYELGTPGATFNPTVGLSFNYSDAELPASVSESSLYIAQWNGSNWVKLTSDVNTSYNTVSTTIASFAIYALLGSTILATTSTLPTTTSPTTPITNTTSTTQVSTSRSTNDTTAASNSPLVFAIAGGAVLLVIVLLVVSRKK